MFAVLADGWSYPLWVVGAARIRNVDDGWPAVGSRLHHSVGSWPLLTDDTTTVVEVDEPKHLRLQARAWPGGEARIEIDVAPHPDGCEVTIDECVVRGPAKHVPTVLQHSWLHFRNIESLRRLSYLCENREAPKRQGSTV